MADDRVEIVELQPSMLPALLPIHLEAFAGYMNVRLGRPYLEAFFRWFVDAPDSVALAAERGGGLLGYVLGAPDGYGSRLSRRLLVPGALGVITHPALLLDGRVRRAVGARALSLVGRKAGAAEGADQCPRPFMSLVAIGVAGSARGSGAAAALIAEFERRSSARGMRGMRLSVYPGNVAARRFYEKAGWTADREPERPDQAVYYFKALRGRGGV